MKRKNLLMAVCTVLATVALAATLGGCAPSQPSGDAGNGGADAASYPVGSLKAVHVAGQLDDADEYPNKLCLSCHDRTTINAANEDFGGIEGFKLLLFDGCNYRPLLFSNPLFRGLFHF